MDRSMGRASSVASLWSWVAICGVVLFGSPVQIGVAVATLPFDRRRLVAGRFLRGMGVVAAKLVPGWSFAVVGPVPRTLPARTVVVSNHESQADPFLISHLPWEMKWLSKASIFRIPLLGWSMWLAGDVPIRRGKSRSAGHALHECARWLDRGVPVMIFPEGTRSLDGNLLPFKDGAFRLAIEAHAHVLPIAVRGTHDALPKHSWRFGRARARVAVGTPIPTEGLGPGDIESLKAQAREQIEGLKARLAEEAPAPRGEG
jgi:1-acyl-sn-glycerol-3-phosphate acyltransferase